MKPRCLIAAIVLFVSASASALAASPAVTGLYPRGVAVGGKAEITVTGKLNPPETKAWCSNPKIRITVPDSEAKLQIEADTDASPGLCWIRFFNAEGATGPLPFVVGRLPEVVEAEPNNELEKAQPVENSVVVNGKLASNGDVDVAAVTLRKDQTLVAAIEANWRLGSPVDMVMQIVSTSGAVVAQVDDDHGFDPLIAFTAPDDGTWYVRTFGFPATPNSSIRFAGGAEYVYRLTLTTGPFVNHCVPSAVTRESDQAVRLVGWNLNEVLQQPIAPEREPFCRVTHPLLPLPARLGLVNGRVTVAEEPCDRSKPLAIDPGMTVCGVIDEPGDADAIRFTATKGQKLVFRVESRALGHPLDPVLQVHDAAGSLVTESDDATRDVFDPLLKFTAKADGDYTVSIRDRFNHGGWRYHWRMHVNELKPGLALTLKADRFVLPPDKPLEIPVTVARNDGFKEEIEVSITGLPDGVTAAPVKSEAKGDTSKSVTLKLTRGEETQPFNGVIEIHAKTADGNIVKAISALAAFSTSTDRIWLTVKPLPPQAADPEKK